MGFNSGFKKLNIVVHYMYFMYPFNLAAVVCSHSYLCSDHFSHPDSFKKINLIRHLQPSLNPDNLNKMSKKKGTGFKAVKWEPLLGVFATLQKAAISFVMSVRQSRCLTARPSIC
jgi:hypothetical protein